MLVVALVVRFFEVVVPADFLAGAFFVFVPAVAFDLAAVDLPVSDLLGIFVVDLVVRAGVFAAVFDVVVAFDAVVVFGAATNFLELPALVRVDLVGAAATRAAGRLAGIAARTCLIALVCSSSVILNSWCPSRLATKYK